METIAPQSLSETWDNTGLLIEAPYPRHQASRVFLTIDLTQQTLEEAIRDPSVGVIISYHPPLFHSVKKLTLQDDRQKVALKCIASGISVFSPHTALDNCAGGINDWLAKGLGHGKTVPIDPIKGNQEGSGRGRIHILENAIPLDQLIALVKKYLGLGYLRVGKSPIHSSKLVSSIAICAGSGGSLLNGVNADVYLTGEMKHSDILEAVANDTSVLLTEHSNSERGYLANVLQPRLLSLLKVDSGLDVESDVLVDVVCSKLDKDPLDIN